MPLPFLILFKGLLEKVKIILALYVSYALGRIKNYLRHWKMFVDFAISSHWCARDLEAQWGLRGQQYGVQLLI